MLQIHGDDDCAAWPCKIMYGGQSVEIKDVRHKKIEQMRVTERRSRDRASTDQRWVEVYSCTKPGESALRKESDRDKIPIA